MTAPSSEALRARLAAGHVKTWMTTRGTFGSGYWSCSCGDRGPRDLNGWECPTLIDINALAARAEGAAAGVTVEALAKAYIHIKGAHKGAYETGEMLGIPCEWCVLAAEQTMHALAALAQQRGGEG